jgi:hypothetical protein
MSDHDMIRRGDALAAAKGFIGAETAIAALPAADPLVDPRVQALVEALEFIRSNYSLPPRFQVPIDAALAAFEKEASHD